MFQPFSALSLPILPHSLHISHHPPQPATRGLQRGICSICYSGVFTVCIVYGLGASLVCAFATLTYIRYLELLNSATAGFLLYGNHTSITLMVVLTVYYIVIGTIKYWLVCFWIAVVKVAGHTYCTGTSVIVVCKTLHYVVCPGFGSVVTGYKWRASVFWIY